MDVAIARLTRVIQAAMTSMMALSITLLALITFLCNVQANVTQSEQEKSPILEVIDTILEPFMLNQKADQGLFSAFGCPKGYIKMNGKCYKIPEEDVGYYEDNENKTKINI
ncbi:unnamed protein product [Arctia plantaginis]|uniref:Uncharacterized protein n=1 Tax=Arctia plantaginis TaxID=874455 RepID=A0A8S0ZRP9_ARCPL|nr:unnamed protein product [Arctia plantaginis]